MTQFQAASTHQNVGAGFRPARRKESGKSEEFWTPAFAGVTNWGTFVPPLCLTIQNKEKGGQTQ